MVTNLYLREFQYLLGSSSEVIKYATVVTEDMEKLEREFE